MVDADTIKEFMKDKSELNFLLNNKEQFDEDLVELAISMTKDDIKATYPSLKQYVDKIPDIVIIYGVISKLLESESFVQIRNEITVSDNNNTATSLYNKQEKYTQLSQLYRSEFLKRLDTLAKRLYYSGCWGSVTSNSNDIEMGDLAYPMLWDL